MKKDFKLQKVLEFRERKCEINKKKLSELLSKKSDLDAKIQSVLDDIEKNRTEMDAKKMVFDFNLLKMYELYIEKLEKNLKELYQLRNTALIEIEKQKKLVVDSINDVKVMEKLKENHIKNYLMYLNKQELKLIDEMVISRFGNDNGL